jgi:hypothetical protein
MFVGSTRLWPIPHDARAVFLMFPEGSHKEEGFTRGRGDCRGGDRRAVCARRSHSRAQRQASLSDKEHFFARLGGSSGQNLVNHGGASDPLGAVGTHLGGRRGGWRRRQCNRQPRKQFFGQFGTNSHYATITQYYDGTGNIRATNLGNTNWFDSSTPAHTSPTPPCKARSSST